MTLGKQSHSSLAENLEILGGDERHCMTNDSRNYSNENNEIKIHITEEKNNKMIFLYKKRA